MESKARVAWENARHKTPKVQQHLRHVRHESTFGTTHVRHKACKAKVTLGVRHVKHDSI